MVWVNFLPWRRRQLSMRLRRDCLLAIALLAFSLVAALPWFEQQRLRGQQQQSVTWLKQTNGQLARLQSRLAHLEQLQEQLRSALAAREENRQRLQAWDAFMQGLADALPVTLWLSELSKTTENLIISGSCLRLAEAEAFRQRLASLPLFRHVKSIKFSRDGQGVIRFSLLATLKEESHG